MRLTRIYHKGELQVGKTIQLEAQASAHVLRVLRLKTGTLLIIFNGEGGEYLAELINIEKKNAIVLIKEFADINSESPLKIHLGQGLSRGERMDIVVQKAVELGVTTITPIITERCNVRLDESRMQKRLQHWQAIIISACEQCGRNTLPVLHRAVSLNEWVAQAQGLKLVADFTAPTEIANQPLEISLLIGPEGGLSDAEIVLAKQHSFKSYSLGPRVLRTETAALAAIAKLQSCFGDM